MSEVKEVTAWAVVDDAGNILAHEVWDDKSKETAEGMAVIYTNSQKIEHRVIRVRITPLPDTEEQK